MQNSCESCCEYPENCDAWRPSTHLKPRGDTVDAVFPHSSLSSPANASVSSPLVPSGLVLFRSRPHEPSRQYSRRDETCDSDCSIEFMKHVFPRLERPTTPGCDGADESTTESPDELGAHAPLRAGVVVVVEDDALKEPQPPVAHPELLVLLAPAPSKMSIEVPLSPSSGFSP